MPNKPLFSLSEDYGINLPKIKCRICGWVFIPRVDAMVRRQCPHCERMWHNHAASQQDGIDVEVW